MPYCLEYDFQNIHIRKRKRSGAIGLALAVMALTGALIAARLGSGIMQAVLFGEGQKTQIAVSNMLNSIQQGQAPADAVEAFCAELIQ